MTNTLGEKAMQLTKLMEAGFPVPKGFIVPNSTADTFFVSSHLKDKILMLLSRCDFSNPADSSRVSKTIQKLILSAEIPGEISEALLSAALKLPKGPVMLTPSPQPNFAGLNLKPIFSLTGESSILLGIRELWAAGFETSNLYAVSASNFPTLSVCVQTQPEIQTTGTLVTISDDKSACVVKAVWGGGGLLGKLVGADLYVLDRKTGEEKDKARNLQTEAVAFRHGQVETTKLDSKQQRKQKLNQTELHQLANVAGKLAQMMYFPQEAAFISDGKNVFVMGVRAAEPEKAAAVVSTPSLQIDRRILLKGLGLTPGITTGMVRVVRSPEERQINAGNILVASKLAHISPDLMRCAKGIVLEEELPREALTRLADKGVTVLSNAAGAVDYLETGSFVTLHSSRGEVLAGGYTSHTETPKPKGNTAIRLGSEIALGSSLNFEPVDNRAHLFLSSKNLAKDVGKQFETSLNHAIQSVASHYPKTPLLYAFNPPRINGLVKPEAEIKTLENLHRKSFGHRISLVIPSVRTAFEIQLWLRALSDRLPRSADTRYYWELSIPSMLWQIQRTAGYVDGVVLDLDKLAEHLFAFSLESGDFHYTHDDLAEPMLAILEMVRSTTLSQGIYLILKGKLLEHDEYLRFAVTTGISELCLPAQDIARIKERLMILEQERVTNV